MRKYSKETYLQNLGKRIRQIRQEKGLTQEAFEDEDDLSITTRALQEIEYGHNDPRAYTLYKIAKRLDVDVADLLKF